MEFSVTKIRYVKKKETSNKQKKKMSGKKHFPFFQVVFLFSIVWTKVRKKYKLSTRTTIILPIPMSVSFLDMNTNHNNQGINQLLMMNGNNNSGNQQQQPPPPPPGQQQMFNQTPQMQYLQGPQPGPQVRNSSVPPPPPPPPQQQMGQPQMQQQQRFNMNMPQQMSQQQMMAAQQQL